MTTADTPQGLDDLTIEQMQYAARREKQFREACAESIRVRIYQSASRDEIRKVINDLVRIAHNVGRDGKYVPTPFVTSDRGLHILMISTSVDHDTFWVGDE